MIHSTNRGGEGGTAVPDNAASYHPAPRPFSNMIPRGRNTYRYTTACAGSEQRGGGHCRAGHRGNTPPPTHFNRKPERDLPAHNSLWRQKGGRAGTAVPDTAASYTQPRGRNPRTIACGGRKERESGHGCARHRGIIHSTERGGGAGTAVPDTAASYNSARGPSQT